MMLLSALPVLLLFVSTGVPLIVTFFLALIDVALIVLLFRFTRTVPLVSGVIVGVMLMAMAAVWLSQFYATTPPLTDAQGQVIPNSIATLEQIPLNGSKQWVSIRGRDRNNPVLLFLAGGPGGSQLTTARHELAGLEDH
ncbi:MAG: hypothetical protein KDE58_23705, partial [Caldilineaceae bacterium]|nr:hypothetical protein [Caldilineaceae bacterium]